jgi:leucyl/phenylalanyl-tRNA--protein transferase
MQKYTPITKIRFPDPRNYEFPEWVLIGDYFYYAKDIVHFGGKLTLENLRNAYQKGIFPWTIEGLPLPWFCPEKRAIIEFSELHIPKSLKRIQKKTPYKFTIDKAFQNVITICSEIKRNGEQGTWITDDFIRVYCELHQFGEAHSVEVWENDELVGGLYGVDAGGVFCGESMFHRRPNTSKLALLFLIEHLKSRGAEWLDAQVMTPHIERLGGKDIERREFLDKLKETAALNLKIF